MREIKFRAWDKQLKEMFNVESINFEKDIVYVNSRERSHIETQRRISDDICTLNQYTGLKDKNGKEIYEKDIFKFQDKEGYDIICEIKWNEEYGMWDCINDDYWFGDHEFDMGEIIGNTFENPELIKEVK